MVIEIISPDSTFMQSILCRVRVVAGVVSTVAVVNDVAKVGNSLSKNLHEESSDANHLIFTSGATFNIHVRQKCRPLEWFAVNLEVLETDYVDGKSCPLDT